MALKPLQASLPLGQFDGLDSEYLTLKGGEVVTFKAKALSDNDLAAKDSFDGYVNPSSTESRVVVTKTIASGNRPLMLADEGVAGYGTLFGQMVGGVVGQVVSGSVIGPSTASGSGKVTCWSTPGLYAVSLDAVDPNATTGLQPTHPTLTTGAPLYPMASGLLTPTSGSAVESVVVARFVEFATEGSLVTTPNSLVSALNSPSGSSGPGVKTFKFAVIHFNPPTA